MGSTVQVTCSKPLQPKLFVESVCPGPVLEEQIVMG